LRENSKSTEGKEGIGGTERANAIPCFCSIAELMLCTGLSRASINRQIQAGNIPIVRIGSRVLIPYSFIESLHSAAEATVKEVKE